LLPAVCSELVAGLAGGELVLLPGSGHLLTQAGGELRTRLRAWLPEVLAAPPAAGSS